MYTQFWGPLNRVADLPGHRSLHSAGTSRVAVWRVWFRPVLSWLPDTNIERPAGRCDVCWLPTGCLHSTSRWNKKPRYRKEMTARCAQYMSSLKTVCKRTISRRLRKNLHITILHLYSTLFFLGGGCSRCTRSPMLGVNERISLKLFGREIIFEEFQPIWSRYLIVTDGQTDGQTTCNLITALCVHIAVKTISFRNHFQLFHGH